MLNITVLNTQLQKWSYYLNKLPTYLRQSEGFIEHFKIWYDLLAQFDEETDKPSKFSNIVGFADTLFNMLNIFDSVVNDDYTITNYYLDYINSLEGSENGTKSDILDKIGSLFSVKRNFELTYDDVDGVRKTKYLRLNNEDFLILIKAQIVQNYFDGTYEQVKEYYRSVGLNVTVTTSTEPATSNIYLIKVPSDSAYEISDDVRAMFLAGLLTIRSMGITYRHSYVDMTRLLYWGGEEDNADEYGWGDLDETIGGQLVI